MEPRRRVVVTGLGAVSAAGRGAEAFWRAAVDGRSGLAPVTRFDVGDLGSPRVGEVPSQVFSSALEETEAGEPAAAFALAACSESLGHAGFPPSSVPRSGGVVLGTCLGGALSAFEWILSLEGGGEPHSPSRLASAGTFSAPARRVASRHGLEGPVVTLSTACASGTAAVGHAAECIRRREADLMLAGGVDALSRFVVAGFWLLRALASGENRPFDRRRDGLALGEGAGIIVLEGREHALRRGARILAEVLGFGSSGDANHMTGPSPTGDGVVRAADAALRDAGCRPDAVEFISAHGTGTRFNDRMETIAIKRVFGERAHRIPVDSVKPIVGHTLGAAGALEAIVCVGAIREGIVPPTLNYAEKDPECDLDYVPDEARRVEVRRALSLSSAFAGNNAALLLGAP